MTDKPNAPLTVPETAAAPMPPDSYGYKGTAETLKRVSEEDNERRMQQAAAEP